MHATVFLDKQQTGPYQACRSVNLELHAEFGHEYSSDEPNSTFCLNKVFIFIKIICLCFRLKYFCTIVI